MGDWSKNFNKSEFACPCCGKFIQHNSLVDMLQVIRDEVKSPIKINSGTRCLKYNNSLSGSSNNSGHLTGESADIYISGWDNQRLYIFLKELYKVGKIQKLTYCYKIVGKTNTAVHVGIDKKNRKSIWGSG
ncbi:MAG: hypothetical protein LBD57_04535 [Endomicrobium sp.]|jgi:uncharacterized protein YcbK (DUF882 family)|uniref:D-Ala-D-Ala carboxypeptidase family metallohydrolase n=1 Tax=Candidatus Endomicrobiellum cubanum TaxID=3242325 RepID=UPI00282D1712|nr:hypothetical protein [Endomicrobium sp.]